MWTTGVKPMKAGARSVLGPDRDRLDSWKEIAVYLRRQVRTVQRWEEREGLPVQRHVHAKASSVCAFKHEIDAWLRSRSRAASEPAPHKECSEPTAETLNPTLLVAARMPAKSPGRSSEPTSGSSSQSACLPDGGARLPHLARTD